VEELSLQTNNPAFSRTFAQNFDYAGTRIGTMTVQGTALKAMLLLAIAMSTATFAWVQTEQGTLTGGFLMGSLIGGFVFALITMFKPTLAPWTSPIYAALEGIFLGALSRIVDLKYPGIAIQAVGLTGGVTFLMLFVYVTGIIKVTGQLVSAIVAATGAIALLYLATILLSLFNIKIPFIFEAGPIGIAFSLFVVGLAAFNLLLDFDFIERGSQAGLSKTMEWYGAFGLMVTLIWLYLEVLRLLSKLRSR
jgi:uncharacterized YccA/Bax inhibitor family protein